MRAAAHALKLVLVKAEPATKRQGEFREGGRCCQGAGQQGQRKPEQFHLFSDLPPMRAETRKLCLAQSNPGCDDLVNKWLKGAKGDFPDLALQRKCW